MAAHVLAEKPIPSDGSAAAAAVAVRGLVRGYGKGKKVLSNLNMTVSEGSIYGLLGPSGCGKTSLLKVLLGLLRPESGQVYVFGQTPGELSSHPIPGPYVGYAPQETALFEDLSIYENIRYHAYLNGMSHELLVERKLHLIELLDLPTDDRIVRTLSGGQQRRVSLLIALLHRPKLLVLDEPTVGVDPVLRYRIWNYLLDLAKEGVTIIITTHYIDECRRASRVGLMRDGHLLAEASPEMLLQHFNTDNLEDVFLELCRLHERKMLETKVHLDPSVSASSSSSSSKKQSKHYSTETTPLLSHSTDASGGNPAGGNPTDSVSVALPVGGGNGSGKPSHTAPIHVVSSHLVLDSNGSSGNLLESRSGGDTASATEQQLHPNPTEELSQLESSVQSGGKDITNFAKVPADCSYKRRILKGNVIAAEFQRVLTRFRRDSASMIFVLLLPTIQIVLFCVCVGSDPSHVPMGIVSRDVGLNITTTRNLNLGTNISLALQADHSLRVTPYDDLAEAIADIRTTKLVAVLFIPENFTANLVQSLESMIFPTTTDLSAFSFGAALDGFVGREIGTNDSSNERSASANDFHSRIRGSVHRRSTLSIGETDETPHAPTPSSQSSMVMYVDKSDWVSAQFVGEHVEDVFQRFGGNASAPLIDTVAIYGPQKTKFIDFMAPGMMVMITFGNSIGLTAISFVSTKKDGCLDRTYATGARATSIVVGNFLAATTLNVLQVTAIIVLAVYGFNIPLMGGNSSLALLYLMQLLLGLVGMSIGLIISGYAQSEMTALQASLGMFFTHLLLSGVLWPLSTVPTFLRYIAYILPTMWSVRAMHDIMERGWGITHDDVWSSLLVNIGWIVLNVLLASRGIRSRK